MTSSIRNIRHVVTSACVAGLLSGCQMFPDDTDLGQIRKIVTIAFSPPPKVTLAQAAAIPYASIGVQIDGGAQGILILATDNGGEQLWTSSSRIAIITRQGRITKTAGLPYNLGASYSPSGEEAQRQPGLARLVDFPNLGLYGVSVFCEEQKIGVETITLLNTPIQAMRSEEHCHSDKVKLSWRFTNRFWRDPKSGFVWRSEQNIHPMLGTITLETLRPQE